MTATGLFAISGKCRALLKIGNFIYSKNKTIPMMGVFPSIK